jgi:hypothetical protein
MPEARTVTLPPMPPIPDAAGMFEPEAYVPDEALAEWVREQFVLGPGPLYNREHEHLGGADVRFLWTQRPNRVKRQDVVGRAHLGEPSGSDAWARGMKADHLTRLFGTVPDFYVTLCAGFVRARLREGDEAAVMALIDHELYHCAQDTRDGVPLFGADGRPKWAMRPHDVEQFVGVTRRWGPQGEAERMMSAAAERGPTIGQAKVAGVCGNCASKL